MQKIKIFSHRENESKLGMLVYFVLGIIEVLLIFRISFKLLGANPNSDFVSWIYTGSEVFLVPFAGAFRSSMSQGIETISIFEPKTLLAILVYALIAYGVVKLIGIVKAPKIKKA